jgi:hypothetical protein
MRYREKRDLIEIENVLVVEEREKSLLVLYEGEEILIPKSQISDMSEVQGNGDKGVLIIPRWLANDRDMLL